MLSCLLNGKTILCFDHEKEKLKKWASKDILLCPACGKPYEYCHGKIRTPYFRHKDKAQCLDLYSEPETEEHLNGKRDLYEWLLHQADVTDVTLEGWLETTKQRPDIMFKKDGKQYVIEYQCSPISTEYYERHSLYETAGIIDIWICGCEKYFQCFHKGSGIKGINELEKIYGLYYYSPMKLLFNTNESLDYDIIKSLEKNKVSNKRIINELNEFNPDIMNYFYIKDSGKNYRTETYYPSPTGRPSNKYPYPATRYIFDENIALAECKKIESISCEDLINNKKIRLEERLRLLTEERRQKEELQRLQKQPKLDLYSEIVKYLNTQYGIKSHVNSINEDVETAGNGYFTCNNLYSPFSFSFHKKFWKKSWGTWTSSEYKKRNKTDLENTDVLVAFKQFVDEIVKELY